MAIVNDMRATEGKRLMDLIRMEMYGFMQIEQAALAQRDLSFQSLSRQLFIINIFISLLMVMFAAGVVVAKVGCVPCEVSELVNSINTLGH